MNLAAIDLNLLVAFDALMAERHVTRAGQGQQRPDQLMGVFAHPAALPQRRAIVDDDAHAGTLPQRFRRSLHILTQLLLGHRFM